MILTTHALTGAVIGKNVENIWLVIILSLASHYILDFFRHGEYLNRKSKWSDFWKVSVDLITGGIMILALIELRNIPSSVQINMFWGAFFSMLPDFLTLLYWKFGVNFLKKLFNFHAWIHRYPPLAPEREWKPRNVINDIIISIVAILFLLL